MEPRIQYAKTEDGVSIAYTTVGEGPPYVAVPLMPFSHIQRFLQIPEVRRGLERQAERRTVIQYDNRGSGSSERNVRDWSLNAHVRDLEAVAEALDLEPFVLWGSGQAGRVAIAYAARHPERVSHLILWCTFAAPRDMGRLSLLFSALGFSLMSRDWNFSMETGARQAVGWSQSGDLAHRMAAVSREAITPQAARKALGLRGVFFQNAEKYLAQVRTPTLVLHRRQVPFPKEEVARRLASRIPGARLVLLEGDSMVPFLGDRQAVARAVNEFLGEEFLGGDEEAGTEEEEPAAGGFATILFTDIESSTALTQRLGDAKAQEFVRAHNAIVRDALHNHGGSEVKHTGDGIMASFPSASRALECSVAIQRAVAAAHADADSPLARSPGEGPGVRVRIGLNAGEPLAEEEDLFGTAVQLAARVCGRAEPGEILVSDVVRQLVAGKGFLFSDLGETELRGFEDPVRLYEVRWREEG